MTQTRPQGVNVYCGVEACGDSNTSRVIWVEWATLQ